MKTHSTWLVLISSASILVSGGLLTSCSTAPKGAAHAPRPPKLIYVSASTGNDETGTGSADHPFASLSKGVEDLSAGDQVILKSGRYPKTAAVVTATGTESAPIRIGAGPGEHVLLQGTGAENGSPSEPEEKTKIASVLDIRSSRFIAVENLEVEESSGFGISVWDSENVTVKGCRIHRTWNRGLGGSGSHLLFEKNEISEAVLQNENESVLRDAERGIKRTWSAAASSGFRPDGSPSTDVIWRGNKISDSWGEGIAALGVDGVKIEHNEIADTYGSLVLLDHAKNVLIDGNWIRNTSRVRARRDEKDVSSGILLASGNSLGSTNFPFQNIKITNNVISNVSIGIGYLRDLSNTADSNRYEDLLIANNLIKDASTATISIAKLAPEALSSAHGWIANNILYEPLFEQYEHEAPSTILLKDPEAWKIDNCLFPNGLPLSNGFSFDPMLADPRAVSPMGLKGFKPICRGVDRLNKGVPLKEVPADFDGRPRERANPSIGPWESCVSPL